MLPFMVNKDVYNTGKRAYSAVVYIR